MPANNEMNLICCLVQLDPFRNDANDDFFLKISKSHIGHISHAGQMKYASRSIRCFRYVTSLAYFTYITYCLSWFPANKWISFYKESIKQFSVFTGIVHSDSWGSRYIFFIKRKFIFSNKKFFAY